MQLTWPRIRLADASIKSGIILLDPYGTAKMVSHEATRYGWLTYLMFTGYELDREMAGWE